MTDQEIIDAIDAEIHRVWDLDWAKEKREANTVRAAYIIGLRFARELIERRTKEVTF